MNIEEKTEEDSYHKRILGHYKGEKKGSTIVFIGGMHGNEPSGVMALQRVFKHIQRYQPAISGEIYGLLGNLTALKAKKRFISRDLNRLWFVHQVNKLNEGEHNIDEGIVEVREQYELNCIIQQILKKGHGPFYFLDLHTTSANTAPFITVNDTLLNRSFCGNFPLPIILGIEEYLKGPLLSYINELGHVSLAFEAGQHDDPASIEKQEAFIWLSLYFGSVISKKYIPNWKKYWQLLDPVASDQKRFYEIIYRHPVYEHKPFLMRSGYHNFKPIKKGEHLADESNKTIKSPSKGFIFMPLYHNQGNDGFFVIRYVSYFWLRISKFLRKVPTFYLFSILPGIRAFPKEESLLVSMRMARFFTKDTFHLFGYRLIRSWGPVFVFKKRDVPVRTARVSKD